MLENNKPILFFDGHCNLCNHWVDYVVKRDPTVKLLIAPLQGETARTLLPAGDFDELSSVILRMPDGQLYYKSSALFQLAGTLTRSLWPLLIFWPLPRFFTDGIYDLVAQLRYPLFGRRSSCRRPTEQEKLHFLP